MTKNITVIYENGIKGSTYPKRASGLVKKGRAQWIGDNTIRLCAPETEVKEMPNNIYDVIDNQFSKLQEKLERLPNPDTVSRDMIAALAKIQIRERELGIVEKQLEAINRTDGDVTDKDIALARETTKQKMLDLLSAVADGSSTAAADEDQNTAAKTPPADASGIAQPENLSE